METIMTPSQERAYKRRQKLLAKSEERMRLVTGQATLDAPETAWDDRRAAVAATTTAAALDPAVASNLEETTAKFEEQSKELVDVDAILRRVDEERARPLASAARDVEFVEFCVFRVVLIFFALSDTFRNASPFESYFMNVLLLRCLSIFAFVFALGYPYIKPFALTGISLIDAAVDLALPRTVKSYASFVWIMRESVYDALFVLVLVMAVTVPL